MAAQMKRGVRLADSLVSLKAGTTAVLSSKETLKFGGRVWTKADLVDTVDGYLVKYDAAEEARNTARKRFEERDAIAGEAESFVKDMTEALRVEHKRDRDTLAKFGIAPPTVRRPLNAQERAAAVQKATATRAAKKEARRQLEALQRHVPAAAAPARPTNTIVLTEAPLAKDANGTSH